MQVRTRCTDTVQIWFSSASVAHEFPEAVRADVCRPRLGPRAARCRTFVDSGLARRDEVMWSERIPNDRGPCGGCRAPRRCGKTRARKRREPRALCDP